MSHLVLVSLWVQEERPSTGAIFKHLHNMEMKMEIERQTEINKKERERDPDKARERREKKKINKELARHKQHPGQTERSIRGRWNAPRQTRGINWIQGTVSWGSA